MKQPTPLAETSTGTNPAMKTLPHWGDLLPLLGASLAYYLGLGWLKATRATANLGECGHAPRRAYATIPTEEWCPAHECWYTTGHECPDCQAEWEQTWTLGEEPSEPDNRADSLAEAADAETPGWPDTFWAKMDAERAIRESWYRDMVRRSDPDNHHNGWRD